MKNMTLAYDMEFQNLTEKNMTFEQVFNRISHFMKQDTLGNYKLMVGTDSQVHRRHTVFITGVVIQREGKGAWACYRKEIVPRRMTNLRERISYETTLTEMVASLITKDKVDALIDIIMPNLYKGSSFALEGHLDIGKGRRNKTAVFISEMVSRIESLGMKPKIKPDSFVASAYANRFTK
jgi:predicted RNase H-related nuclease YkuK (DUF458 family)